MPHPNDKSDFDKSRIGQANTLAGAQALCQADLARRVVPALTHAAQQMLLSRDIAGDLSSDPQDPWTVGRDAALKAMATVLEDVRQGRVKDDIEVICAVAKAMCQVPAPEEAQYEPH